VRALEGRAVATFRPEAAAEAGGPTAEQLGAAAFEILDMQSEMVSLWRPDGTITYCNAAFARQCGRSRDAVIGRSLFDLTPAEELGQILANVAHLSPSHPTAGYDHRIPAAEGADRWQAWIDRALFDQEGRVMGYLSVGRDITARKEAERRLAESEQRLKLALEAGRQGVWEVDLAAGRIQVDQTFEQLLAIPAGSYALDLEASYLAYHPDDRERVRAAMEAVIRGDCPDFRVEARRLAGDGRWRWLMNFGRIAERGADGQARRMVGTTIDINERRVAEARLREGEQRLRLALEAGGLGVWESDLVTDTVRFDPICLARVGLDTARRYLSLGEVIDLVHPRDRAMVRATYARCRRGELAQCRLEYRVRRHGGGQLWIEEHARVAERAPDGTPLRLVGVSADITARKEAELQLAHMALHDPLTGLPNRRALAEALERAIARARRSGQPLAAATSSPG
jgi:PAS domain S-box-containing protein